MKHRLFTASSAVVCTVLSLLASVPVHANVSPWNYGNLRSRETLTGGLRKTSPANEKGGQLSRVAAFAGDGVAEVEKYGTLIPVVEEDFSLLTTGSETEPDLDTELAIPQWLIDPETGLIVRDGDGNPVENPDFEYPHNNMKPEYTHTPGWGVGNAYPAGGMLYFPFDQMNTQGKISTHWLDFSAYDGTIVVEFRVKLAKPQPTEGQPCLILVEAAETNGMSPTWSFFEDPFTNSDLLSDEWTTFRVLFQGAGESTIVNIVGMGLDGGMFIDDIKVFSLKPYLPLPRLRRHSEFTGDSFVANWHPSDGAEKYLLDVWYEIYPGKPEYVVEKAETTSCFYKVEDLDPETTYFYTVKAVGGGHESLQPRKYEVFDIVAPAMRDARQTDDGGHCFSGGVEPVVSAYGYNYFAESTRVAEEDGPFVITNEDFTGWRHPAYADDEFYTKENPDTGGIAELYYPTDIRQQGWHGENFAIYKDYICLAAFFTTATFGQQQSGWISPEFDLSRDGGRFTIDMKLAAAYDAANDIYSRLAAALFNWNEEKGDFEQVELIYCDGLNFDWQERKIEFTKGSSRSVVGLFATGSYSDLYMDDIVIRQNFRKGDRFSDPFFFRTWQLAETEYADDPTTFEFTVPDYASGREVTQKAQAVRIHFNESGGYDGEKASLFAENAFVANVPEYSGVSLVERSLPGTVTTRDGHIIVSNPERHDVSVVCPDGRSINLGNGESVSHIPDSRGVYIVCLGGTSVKIAL